MNLRWTILGLIAFTFLGLVLIFTISLQSLLIPHFRTEEMRASTLNVQRALRVLENNFSTLTNTSKDWARWDDTYQFVQSVNPSFVQDNLSMETFIDLDVNILAFIDLEGNLVYGKAFDLRQQGELPLPDTLRDHIVRGDLLLARSETTEPRFGLLATEQGPLGLVSAPVLRTSGAGPAVGTFLIGRYFDESELLQIASIVQFPLMLARIDQPGIGEDFQEARQNLDAAGRVFTQPINESQLAGYALLNDFYGQPAYILRVEQARTIFRNGQIVLRYLYAILFTGALLFSLLIMWFLDRLVLSRLRQLGSEVTSIGQTGQLDARVPVTRKDELSQLAGAINHMLGDLQVAMNRRKESEERFRLVVESMDDIVFIVDNDMTRFRFFGERARNFGIPEEINLPGKVEISALKDSDLQQVGLQMQMSVETLHDHFAALQLALTGMHLTYDWNTVFNEQTLYFQTVLSPVLDEQEQLTGVVGVGRDITELKRLENTLRRRADDLSALNTAARVYLGRIDAASIAQESCRLLVDQFRMDAGWVANVAEDGEVLQPLAAHGLRLHELPDFSLTRENRNQPHPVLKALLTNQILTIGPETNPENRIWSPPEDKFLNALCVPASAGNLRFVMTVFSNQAKAFSPGVVQLIQALANLTVIAANNATLFGQVLEDQRSMQGLSRRLVEIQEEESKRIALELHDEIGQLLTGLKLQIDVSRDQHATHPEENLKRANALVEELIQKVRNLSLDLRPSMLDDLGLLPTLLWHLDRYHELTGIAVNLQQFDLEDHRFPTEVETVAYRIIQEALTNVARHSGASEATVHLHYGNGVLTIQIEDRGRGFSAQEVLAEGRSRGLMGMRERVALVNGTLTIDSVPGWGTSLLIELPVRILELERSANDHDITRG